MKIKERTLKGWFSIAYFLLFLGLLLSGIRMHKNILSLLSFSCLGLSVRQIDALTVQKSYDKFLE